MNPHVVSGVIAVVLAGSILYLVRRDHLHGPYALWWLLVAVATLLLGAVPRTVDWLGRLTGINYPPVLPIVVAVALILLRLLKMDIDRSQQEKRLRRLTQKLGILQEELRRERGGESLDEPADEASDSQSSSSAPKPAHGPAPESPPGPARKSTQRID